MTEDEKTGQNETVEGERWVEWRREWTEQLLAHDLAAREALEEGDKEKATTLQLHMAGMVGQIPLAALPAFVSCLVSDINAVLLTEEEDCEQVNEQIIPQMRAAVAALESQGADAAVLASMMDAVVELGQLFPAHDKSEQDEQGREGSDVV